MRPRGATEDCIWPRAMIKNESEGQLIKMKALQIASPAQSREEGTSKWIKKIEITKQRMTESQKNAKYEKQTRSFSASHAA